MKVLCLPFDGDVEVFDGKEAVDKIVDICKNSTTSYKKIKDGKAYFYNVALTYDIETTKVLNEYWNEKIAEMYKYFSYPFCWSAQFGNMEGDFFIFARDASDFFDMLDEVSDRIEHYVPSFIHNDTFEYNNLKDYFHRRKDTKVVMRNASTPLYIIYGKFKFSCTAQLTHKSLDQLGKEIGYMKLKGKFDYSKPRHTETPLTLEEIISQGGIEGSEEAYDREDGFEYSGHNCSLLYYGRDEFNGGKPFTGLYYELYENGKLESYGMYQNGMLKGNGYSFYGSGKMNAYRFFSEDGLNNKIKIDDDALITLAKYSGGDLRFALNKLYFIF